LILLSTNHSTDGRYKDCSDSAGLETGQIPDEQVSASSFIKGHHPSQGRLNNKVKQVNGYTLWGSWCANTEDMFQYIQVDLKEVRNISGVASQGSSMGTWVTEYTLNYSLDGILWKTYRNQSGEAKMFRGNWDEMTVHKNMFERRIRARFVRFNPRAWRLLGQLCMRVEIYLCQVYQGCSRSTEPLPKTTAAVSSTGAYQAHTGTEAVTSHTTINTFTQQENPAISKVVKSGLYSNGIRNSAICTVWLAIVWLILATFVVQ